MSGCNTRKLFKRSWNRRRRPWRGLKMVHRLFKLKSYFFSVTQNNIGRLCVYNKDINRKVIKG
jgi:hypothetical protein